MEPVQALIAPAIARLVRPAPLTPEKVLFAWRVSVGPAIARVTRVRLGLAKVLDVEVTDARWRAEVERSAGAVIERVRALLGPEEVARIQFSGPTLARRRPARTSTKSTKPAGRRSGA